MKGRPSRRYQPWKRRAILITTLLITSSFPDYQNGETHQLELHGHQAEVDNLDRRPQNVVGLERRHIHVPHLVIHAPLSTALGQRHGSEEARETEGRKDELVESHPLQSRQVGARLGDGEASLEEAEPLELQGRHAEAVRHEAGQPLKVERRRQVPRLRDKILFVEGVLPVELVDLVGDGVVTGVRAPAGWVLAEGSLADRRDGLGYRVGDSTQDRIGHHHREHCMAASFVSSCCAWQREECATSKNIDPRIVA